MSNTQLSQTELVRQTLFSTVSPGVSHSLQVSIYVTALYTLSLFLPDLGTETDAIRAVSGFVLLTFVPGLLVLRMRIERFRSIDLLYAVALSVVISTFIAWAANGLYRSTFVFPKPFVENRLTTIYILSISGLAIASWYSTRARSSRETFETVDRIREYDPRVLVSLLCLPAFATAGALILNGTGENVVILSVLAICAFLPIVALIFDNEDRYLGLILLSVSFALIMQRALIKTYLAFGDGMRAYSATRAVLSDGYWVPHGTLEAMPRIAPLQAAYTLIMDIPLLWVFKLAHPLVFVLTPVIGYALATRYFSKRVAFLGMILYVFLPETYRLLPRNTRTGAAIFFSVVLVAVILDSGLKKGERFGLSLAVFWGMIGSHYGVGPLFFLLLGPGFALYWILVRLGGDRRPMIDFTGLTLFGIITYSWYLYQSQDTFEFTASVIIDRALNFATPTSNTAATNAVSYGYPSLSYEVFFYSHLLIAALACASIGGMVLLHVLDLLNIEHSILMRIRSWVALDADNALRNGAYLSTILGLAVLFPLSFGPNILSSARTFGLLFVFMGPFAILATRLPKVTRFRFAPAGVLLLVILLVTSGFVSATVTHDASRVPNFDRDRIMESGDRVEQFALYRVYTPENSVFASSFISTYIPTDRMVYKSLLGTYHTQLRSPGETDPQIQNIQKPTDLSEGYTYVAQVDTTSETITTGFNGFVYYEYFDLPEFVEKNKVYTNGPAKIYE